MANEFNKRDLELIWQSTPYCALCTSNQGCAFHHLNSKRMPHTSSVYNAILLCTQCHRIADSMNTGSPRSKEYRQKLLKITLRKVTNSEYVVKDVDKRYLEYIADDLNDILNAV